jgi:ribosomal protein S18 acetylase RimI-like enzyme
MAKITYQDADTDADFEFCRLVHHSAYRDVVCRQFGSWDESIQDGFFRDKWNRLPHKILAVDDVPVGVLSAVVQPDGLYLNEIQILPGYQGAGIGSLVLKVQMEHSKSLELPLRLQVLRENKAQELYQRLGFQVTGTTETHVKMEWNG